MTKNKRILVSLCISLVLLVIFNVIYLKLKKEDEQQAFVVVKSIATGESITSENTKTVTIKTDEKNSEYITELPENSYSAYALKAGQILTSDLFEKNIEENLEEYEYISLPVADADDAVSYKLKKGSKVNIYYTAKYSDVSEVLTGSTNAKFSSKSAESIITTKLYDGIEVIDLTDSVGQENGLYTQIQIRVKKEDVTRLVCLKELGIFTLTMSGR